jgi:UDP-glucose 4-epimerase
MRIFITGPTSFSGAFFIEELAKAGHEVFTTLTKSKDSYSGIRGLRAAKALEHAQVFEGVSFGDEQFLQIVQETSFDVFCHHGAWTENYNSMDYNFQAAYENNTKHLPEVSQALAANGCKAIVISASIFEGGIKGSTPFSPHGLIKQITSQTTAYYANHAGLHFSRFVIPNPFGALDNPKLIDYLCREWYAKRTPQIRTPLYVRDNIHVELMAKGFVYWLENLPLEESTSVFAPAGMISTMGDFVEKVASEMRPRLGLACQVILGPQADFSQPMVLVNDTPLDHMFDDWNENIAWDALAAHQKYLQDQRNS